MSGGQLVYLDESGDAGFKVGAGSTPALVVAATIFDTPAHAAETAAAIHAYRMESLQLGSHFQFHFSNLSREWRIGFFKAVRLCPFRIRAIVMRKDRIWPGSMLRKSGEWFYNFTVKELLGHTFGTVNEAKLFIDGNGGRESLKRMVTYLRRECNTPQCRVIDQVRYVPKSDNNVLVQLADMVNGAIARSFRPDKADRDTYRSLLKPRIETVWEFGKQTR